MYAIINIKETGVLCYVFTALFAMRAKVKLAEDVCPKRTSRNCLPDEKHKRDGVIAQGAQAPRGNGSHGRAFRS